MTEQFIFEIMDKFNSSQIVDLDLVQADARITLRKKEGCCAGREMWEREVAAREQNASAKVYKKSDDEEAGAFVQHSGGAEVAEKGENSAASQNQKAMEENCGGEVLKSPIVGTFYRSPSPDSPAYAQKGKKIKKGEPVCIIEAMKMMNTLNAEYDFEVVDVLVENGQLVEFDEPLFAIKKL